MSENRGHCPECGGSDGFHYSDCIYDGTDGPRGYYSGDSGGKIWVFYIIALLIGYGFNELIGTIMLIGMIVWLIANR